MVSKYLALNGKVSVICANTTEFLKEVNKLQKYTSLSNKIIGMFYTASSMMAFSEIKEESDELIIEIDGKGESGVLYSIVKRENENVIIKGFIDNPNLSEDRVLEECIGKNGNLTVVKNNIYTKLGYRGITPLISGNIVNDFKGYFENSTQKPAFCDIEISEKIGFGYLITFMPDCSDEDISKIEKTISSIDFKNVVNNNISNDEFAKLISGDDDILKVEDNLKVFYRCDCSREKYLEMLYTLKKSDLEMLIKEDDKINIVCQYCNKSYDFSKEELENIIKNL